MIPVTRILEAIEQGDSRAAEELLPLVYEELRRLAAQKMAQQEPGQTLQATALVHEAYLRLVGSGTRQWPGRAPFFRAAAEAMRHILVDKARRKQRIRHGGDQRRLDVNELQIPAPADDQEVLVVHQALDQLAAKDAEKAEVVKLRFFVGLNNQEAARILGITEKTVRRHWTYAKAWLSREIRRQL